MTGFLFAFLGIFSTTKDHLRFFIIKRTRVFTRYKSFQELKLQKDEFYSVFSFLFYLFCFILFLFCVWDPVPYHKKISTITMHRIDLVDFHYEKR